MGYSKLMCKLRILAADFIHLVDRCAELIHCSPCRR